VKRALLSVSTVALLSVGFARPAFADDSADAAADEPTGTPALEVVRLKPSDATIVSSAADKTVDLLLTRISDKQTGEIEHKAAFDQLVSLDDAALNRLGQILRDPNARFDQRWVSARALGRIGGMPAVRLLRTTLAEDKFSMIRLAAIAGLKDLNDAGSYDLLVKCLQDDALVVRSAAADALGTLGDARAVDPLIQALNREDNFYKGHSLWVRRHIIAALGAIDSRASVKALIKALDDQDPTVTREAIASLERVTKVTFKVPANDDAELVAKATPKWKSWWETNKKDYL
jgi:HEAT repeat protein